MGYTTPRRRPPDMTTTFPSCNRKRSQYLELFYPGFWKIYVSRKENSEEFIVEHEIFW